MDQNRIRFIEHNAIPILYMDYRDLKVDAVMELMPRAHEVISRAIPGSLLSILDVEGTAFNPEIARRAKEYTRLNTPFERATAVVGMNGMQRMIYRTAVMLTGRSGTLRAFATRQEGLEWLARIGSTPRPGTMV
jgi:hypothetical protein